MKVDFLPRVQVIFFFEVNVDYMKQVIRARRENPSSLHLSMTWTSKAMWEDLKSEEEETSRYPKKLVVASSTP